MKGVVSRLLLASVTLILVTQLFAPAGAAQCGGQGRNRKYSMRVDPSSQTGEQRRGRRRRGEGTGQRGNWCHRRCRREYAQCLNNAGGNQGRRRSCVVRYRNCLRRC